jgi:hypothetical protein
VFRHEPFKQLYLAHLRKFNTTLFRPERLQAQVDEAGGGSRPRSRRSRRRSWSVSTRWSPGRPSGREALAVEGSAACGLVRPAASGPKPSRSRASSVARAKSVDQLAGRSQG